MLRSSIKSALARAFRSGSFRSALFAFALTRAIVLATLVLAANAQPEGHGPAFGAPVEEVRIYVRQHGIIGRLAEAMTAADGLWYLDIAQNGYEKENFNLDKQHNWAFFPLYPLIIELFAGVTREFSITAALLSNIFFLAALVILHRTALTFDADSGAADRGVFYLAAFPTSYFFSFPFTESLFLLVTVSSFYCARREMWWRAGALGALATATRLAGIFLLPALLILYWQQYRGRGRPQIF